MTRLPYQPMGTPVSRDIGKASQHRPALTLNYTKTKFYTYIGYRVSVLEPLWIRSSIDHLSESPDNGAGPENLVFSSIH